MQILNEKQIASVSGGDSLFCLCDPYGHIPGFEVETTEECRIVCCDMQSRLGYNTLVYDGIDVDPNTREHRVCNFRRYNTYDLSVSSYI